MPKRENGYQADLIKRISARWRGRVFIMKNDATLKQGILDLTLLFDGGFWALLEVKISEDARHQPNQDFYVKKFDDMSFAAFIYPENEEAVLNELEQEYEAHWATRLS